MAVAVQTDVSDLPRRIECGMNPFQQIRRQRIVGGLEMLWYPAELEQVVARLEAHPVHVDLAAMLKTAAAPDHVDATEETTHPLALLARAELRPAPAPTPIQGEAEPFELEQRQPGAHQRRLHGNLCVGELEREAVLLADRGVAPAPRPIELRDERLALLDAHLVHAVLIAVERQNPPVREPALGLHGRNDHVRREPLVRVRLARGIVRIDMAKHRKTVANSVTAHNQVKEADSG